jgi:DNA gyrase subunit B
VGDWQADFSEEAITLRRIVRGVSEQYSLSHALIKSADGRRLSEITVDLQEVYGKALTLLLKDKKSSVSGPVDLIETIMEQARKEVTIQRYKGLGEMNAIQLWETTLDPNARTLLQVKISHVDEAEEVFSTLMGDVVEPRRDFIQANALKVSNLDA